MKHCYRFICIVLLIGSCFCLPALRSNAQTLKRSEHANVICAFTDWERIYPNAWVKQTGLFQRTITWNQRSDAARAVFEAVSFYKPEGDITGQVSEYPYRYRVAEIITGQPGWYTYVQEFPIRPDIFDGYALREYRYLDTDEPCYGYGFYWLESAHFVFLPMIRR